MAKYVVVAASVGITTGKNDPLTHLPDVRRFSRGAEIDSDKFDTEAGKAKLKRLLQAGAIRDEADPPAPSGVYQTPFDIPLDRDPGGEKTPEQPGIVVLPDDDLDEDEESDDDSDPETFVEPDLSETDEQEAAASDEPAPPSRGASAAVWHQYAKQIRLDVPEDASRTEIQDAYDARQAS